MNSSLGIMNFSFLYFVYFVYSCILPFRDSNPGSSNRQPSNNTDKTAQDGYTRRVGIALCVQIIRRVSFTFLRVIHIVYNGYRPSICLACPICGLKFPVCPCIDQELSISPLVNRRDPCMKTEGDRIDQKLNDHSGTACLLDSSPHAPTVDTLWLCIGFVERSPHN